MFERHQQSQNVAHESLFNSGSRLSVVSRIVSAVVTCGARELLVTPNIIIDQWTSCGMCRTGARGTKDVSGAVSVHTSRGTHTFGSYVVDAFSHFRRLRGKRPLTGLVEASLVNVANCVFIEFCAASSRTERTPPVNQRARRRQGPRTTQLQRDAGLELGLPYRMKGVPLAHIQRAIHRDSSATGCQSLVRSTSWMQKPSTSCTAFRLARYEVDVQFVT